MLAGDFTAFTSPACNVGRQITLRAPFVNNQVDPSLFSPFALKLLKFIPTADPAYDPDGCGRYPLAIPNDSTEQQLQGSHDPCDPGGFGSKAGVHRQPPQQIVFQIQYLQPMTNRYTGLHFTASRIGRTAGASISRPSKAVENTFLPML